MGGGAEQALLEGGCNWLSGRGTHYAWPAYVTAGAHLHSRANSEWQQQAAAAPSAPRVDAEQLLCKHQLAYAVQLYCPSPL